MSHQRGDEVGHSAETSFYFGTDEEYDGGGHYAEVANARILSPLINLAGITDNITLSFNHFLEMRASWGLSVDVATVGIVVNGRTSIILHSNVDGGLANTTSNFESSTGGFTPVSYDITSFAGEQIQIEFNFWTNADFTVATLEGWYVDDVIVKGTPISSRGAVRIEADDFGMGITVSDSDLGRARFVSVVVEATSGDIETITLDRLHIGLFRGVIVSELGTPVSDGVLQVSRGDTVTVTYFDEDDGQGNAVTVSDSITVTSTIELLRAEFHDDAGESSADGFTSSGEGDQWHLSTGRANYPGHSSEESFYFGAGEDVDGGGQYDNNVDATLISPIIDLAGVEDNVTLSFNHFLDVEVFYDVVSVAVISQGNVTVIADNDFVGGLPSFTGSFTTASFDITSYVPHILN